MAHDATGAPAAYPKARLEQFPMDHRAPLTIRDIPWCVASDQDDGCCVFDRVPPVHAAAFHYMAVLCAHQNIH